MFLYSAAVLLYIVLSFFILSLRHSYASYVESQTHPNFHLLFLCLQLEVVNVVSMRMECSGILLYNNFFFTMMQVTSF